MSTNETISIKNRYGVRPPQDEYERAKAECHDLIDELFGYMERTSFSNQDEIVPGRDEISKKALVRSGYLLKLVAGWAIAHMIGKEVRKVDLYPLDQPTLDSVVFEQLGATIEQLPMAFFHEDGDLQRRVLQGLLSGMPPILPRGIQHSIIRSLEHANHGKSFGMFDFPPSRARKNYLLQQQIRMITIMSVEFKIRAFGMKKYVAQNEVGKIFGVEGRTVDTWKKTLSSYFGDACVEQMVIDARKDGEKFRAAHGSENDKLSQDDFPYSIYSNNFLRSMVDRYDHANLSSGNDADS